METTTPSVALVTECHESSFVEGLRGYGEQNGYVLVYLNFTLALLALQSRDVEAIILDLLSLEDLRPLGFDELLCAVESHCDVRCLILVDGEDAFGLAARYEAAEHVHVHRDGVGIQHDYAWVLSHAS